MFRARSSVENHGPSELNSPMDKSINKICTRGTEYYKFQFLVCRIIQLDGDSLFILWVSRKCVCLRVCLPLSALHTAVCWHRIDQILPNCWVEQDSSKGTYIATSQKKCNVDCRLQVPYGSLYSRSANEKHRYCDSSQLLSTFFSFAFLRGCFLLAAWHVSLSGLSLLIYFWTDGSKLPSESSDSELLDELPPCWVFICCQSWTLKKIRVYN